MKNRHPSHTLRLSLALALAALVAGSAACKAKVQTTETAKDGKKDEAQAVATLGGGGKRQAIAEESRGDLAAYLLTSGEAQSLRPVVERYRKPGLRDPGGRYTDRFEPYRTFTEDFLTRAMGVEALKPGRKVGVRIADDEAVNAFAGAFQDVTITVGTISNAEGTQLLAVLCHELAHSAQNHSLEYVEFTLNKEMIDLSTAWTRTRDEFVGAQYDATTTIYTHSAQAYQAALAAWKNIQPRLSTFSKRQEAEADLIGGEICGHLGMPPETYAASLASFLSTGEAIDAQGEDGGPESLSDGDRFKLDQQSLIGYLFPVDSHPSLAERKDNIARAKDVLAEHFDAKSPLFAEWEGKYRSLATGLGLSGLGLSEAVRSNVRNVTTDGGKLITVKKRHICGQ